MTSNEVLLERRPSWLNYTPHIVFAWLVIPLLVAAWRRHSVLLQITKDKVVLEKGVLGKQKKQVYISDIRTIDIEKSVAQRVFGIGDIMIATAGTSGYEDVAPGMPSPEEVKDIVNKQRKKEET